MDQILTDTQNPSAPQDEILIAALKLFVQKGYFNTSLIDIKEAAGINNISIIYQFFKSKQTIAAQLHSTILDNLNISIDEIRRKNEKPSEQLRGIVDLLFQLSDEAPEVMHFLLILDINKFLPRSKPFHESAAFNKIIRIIEAGIREGEIRNISPQLCYSHFFGLIDNTLRLKLTGLLNKKADFYQSQTWLAAWSVIAKKSNSKLNQDEL